MIEFEKYDFNNKTALIRVDFNVPLNEKLEVTDNTRIKAALPTIKHILQNGGKVILMSHLGRPKGEISEKYSLKNIIGEVESLLEQSIAFAPNCIGEQAQKMSKSLEKGSVLLLENLRFHSEEKKGDEAFAKQLAGLNADVYVNDAFGTAHRSHASVSTIAQFFPKNDRLPGLLMSNEVNNGKKVMEQAESPFIAILGGAKVSDKILLIENLLDKADKILIGGAMAFTFIKAAGGKIGKSLVEDDKLDLARSLSEQAGDKLVLPTDVIIADDFSNDAQIKICDINEIPDGWMGLDVGAQSRERYHNLIVNGKTILWNGPMGVFEMENFKVGTESVAKSLAQASAENEAFTMVGGGDSVAAVKQLGFEDKMSFISTGGGAMLEFFEGKVLPGIAALEI